jgi:hypothetical protein
MKKLFLAILFWLLLGSTGWAQNVTCATRPVGDNSNACASTAFVQQNGGGTGNLTIGTTVILGGVNGECLYDNSGVLGVQACGSGGSTANKQCWTATSQSYCTGTFTAGTTTTLTLGAGTIPSSVAGLTIYIDGVQQGPAYYSLNTTTGVITFASALASTDLEVDAVTGVASGGASGNVVGSGTSVSGDLPQLSNTSTTAIIDSGIPEADVVQGGSTSSAGNVAEINNTNSTQIIDSGVAVSSLASHGKACFVDGVQYSTVAAALSASCAQITVQTNLTQSSPITSSASGVTINCAQNTSWTFTAGSGFTVSGSDWDFGAGCGYIGPGKATVSTGSLIIFTGQREKFHDANVVSWGAVQSVNSNQGIVQWGPGANYADAYNNNFNGNGDISLAVEFGSTNPQGFNFHDNKRLEDLLFIATNHTFKAFNVRVHHNNLVAGSWAGQQGICLFVADTLNASVDGNSCELAGNIQNGVGGVYSFADNVKLTASNNVLTIGSFDIGGTNDFTYEFNGCQGCTVTGNYGETSSGNAGFVAEGNEFTTFQGNVEQGCGNSNSTGCFDFTAVSGGGGGYTMTGLSSKGNIALFSSSATIGVGFNFNGASSTSNTFLSSVGDTVMPPTSSSSTFGVNFAGNGGTLSNIQVGPDNIGHVTNGVVSSGTVSNLCYTAGANYAATPTGVTSTCH